MEMLDMLKTEYVFIERRCLQLVLSIVIFYTYTVVQKKLQKFNAPSFCNRLQ